ncbi:MAG: glycosyl hydrolase 108 family protein [Comamonas sp.]
MSTSTTPFPPAFEQAFAQVIGHEGGYVNDPRDPGGETKYGISKRAYPQLDIAGLTLADAKAIYLRDYWLRARCDQMAPGLAFDVFDFAVNSGIGTAIRHLQRALGLAEDGVVGPQTLAELARANVPALRARFSGHRLQFMSSLSTWPTFGRGWARRVAGNLQKIGGAA